MKRRLVHLALFLFLGAIVNVAVAWGCVTWTKLDPLVDTWTYDIVFRDGEDLAVTTARSQGAMLITSDFTVDLHMLGLTSDSFPYTSEISKRFTFVHPTDDNLQELTGFKRVLTAYGWPKLALWSGYEADGFHSSGYWIRSGIRISGTQAAPYGFRAVPLTLPLHPIWPGFAINTIFYAAILWLLTLGPFTARRMIRRKRGLCIKCGYDLRNVEHAKCPECGVSVDEA